MGSTVTTGKRAAAYRADDGEIIYVLYEETYSKNDTPYTPSWSATSFGTIAQTLKKIFGYASPCEGGMLQNRNGRITPEGYIAGWMKELADPVWMPDRVIHVAVENSYSASIPLGEADAVMTALTTVGLTDLRDRLLAGEKVLLQLYKDAKAIATIYGAGPLWPWRILSRNPPREDRNALLGYAPAPAKNVTLCQPAALQLREDRFLQREDGSWYAAGRAYSIVANYVENLWESELRAPGGYRNLIKAYRTALATAPSLPSGSKVVVDATMDMDDYDRRELRQFTTKFPVISTPRGFEVDLTPDNAYYLTNIRPKSIVTWVFPGEPAKILDNTTPHEPGQLNLFGEDTPAPEAAPPARRLRP